MFFGVMRPQTWPGTKGGRSRFHQRPSAARAGRQGGKRNRPVTASASIRSVDDLSKHRIYIEDVYPVVDGGRFPVKRIVGDEVDVWADIFRDGHVVLAAELLWRREGADKWLRVPMVLHDNDRWRASFRPPKVGRYVYAIEAWTDVFASWRRDFLTKRAAGMDVSLEIEEGRNLLADLRLKNSEQARLIRDVCRKPDIAENPDPLLSQELAATASKGQQSDLTRSATYPLVADRPIARAGAWYEMVPRSQSRVPGKHGTFDDCINRLPEIGAMGFDVLYLPPIHPIGRANRKGRNNSLHCKAGDPGSLYAIGSAEGGHDAVHPELGTLDDFRRLVRACAEPRPGHPESWINEPIVELYGDLFARGHAHSIECRHDGRLVGGLYGVTVGAAFFGESMFSRVRDASKVALVHLAARLVKGQFRLLDCQFMTEHLRGFGAVELEREAFKAKLADAVDATAIFYGDLGGEDPCAILQATTRTS